MGSPGALFGEDLVMGVKLYSDVLDDARRRDGDFGKRTKKKAEERQIERDTRLRIAALLQDHLYISLIFFFFSFHNLALLHRQEHRPLNASSGCTRC
jgi:hypothetical protein